MPASYTHQQFGNQVLNKLENTTIKKIIYDVTSFPGKDASSLKSIILVFKALIFYFSINRLKKILSIL